MWGRKNDARGERGRRSRNRRGSLLEVNARGRSRPRINAKACWRLIGVPVVVVAALGLAALGLRAAGGLLFSRNAAFTIRHLSIDTEDGAARGYLETKRGIRKGLNLFAFDIQDVRREFLRLAPNYKAIRITRVLPDTLTVAVTPRQPLALMGRRGGFVVDAEGFVFGQRNAPAGLPLIIGYQGPFLKPGERLQGLPADAAHLVDVWLNADIEHELIIRTIDVRGGFRGAKDALQLTLEGDMTVDLAWPRARRGTIETGDDLRERILFLRAMRRRAEKQGQRLKEVDLTLDDYRQKNSAQYWY